MVEKFKPTEVFEERTKRENIDPNEVIDDPEFAETMAYSIKGLRERSRELVEIAESLKGKDEYLAKMKTYEAAELEFQARVYEERLAVDIKRIQEKESQGLDTSKEKRDLKFSLAEAYLGGGTSVIGSKYRRLLDKLGMDSSPSIQGMTDYVAIDKVKGITKIKKRF